MDSELVSRIVQQVIEQMQKQGPIAAAPAPSRTKGIYVPATRSAIAKQKTKAAPATPAKIFVTAQMLAQRIAGGAVELKHNEYLTPNARDLADEKHLTIRKAAPKAPAKAVSESPSCVPCAAAASSAGKIANIAIMVDRPDGKVQTLLSHIQRRFGSPMDFSEGSCTLENLKQLAQAVSAGQAAMGVAILPYAADAMVLCGKVKGVRPVQGTRCASVEAAVRHFEANLLVIEHAFCTLHEMRLMIEAFASGRTRKAAAEALMENIASLERSC